MAMKFAARTNWELTTNPITDLVERLKSAGRAILDLTESNPSRCGFAYPREEILKVLSAADNLDYRPHPAGLLSARQAVCDYYARKNIAVQPDQVFLTASTSEAYSFLFRLLADPGERMLFSYPSYPLFQFLVDLNDLQMARYRLVYDGKWRIDFASLAAGVDESTRGVVVVNPNNPTGSGISDDERRGLQAFCRERSLPIIADEVFLDYPFNENQEIKSLLVDPQVLTLVMGGISKTLGLPQMKVSWIVVAGPSPLVRQARERLEVIADTYLSVNTPAQTALPAWLELFPVMQKEILGRVRANRQYLLAQIQKTDGIRVLNSSAGWYAMLAVPEKFAEEEVVLELLKQDQVFVHPGYFFDCEQEPLLVLSLIVPTEIFAAGLRKIIGRISG